MWLSLVRIGLAAVIALAASAASTQAAPAQPETRPPESAAIDSEEGFSADDIKDVFEAIQFIMFSMGVGAALYWFWYVYLPSKKLPRIEFDVDVERVGENDAAWFIEIVALVKNRGRSTAELTELHFTLESVLAGHLSAQSGLLAKMNALAPLFEGESTLPKFVLDAGTQTRRAVAAAIPKTVDLVVVTAQVRNAKRAEVYDASRLVRLNSGPSY